MLKMRRNVLTVRPATVNAVKVLTEVAVNAVAVVAGVHVTPTRPVT